MALYYIYIYIYIYIYKIEEVHWEICPEKKNTTITYSDKIHGVIITDPIYYNNLIMELLSDKISYETMFLPTINKNIYILI